MLGLKKLFRVNGKVMTDEGWRKYLSESATEARNSQVGGGHYAKLKIQPLEYSYQNNLGAAEHTVIKYVTRWRDKGGVEDLRKARHTLDLLIEMVEKESGNE